MRERLNKSFQIIKEKGFEPEWINDQFMDEYQYVNDKDCLITVRYCITTFMLYAD